MQRWQLGPKIEGMLSNHPFATARMNIADIGCGCGHWLQHFSDRGVADRQIFGVDNTHARFTHSSRFNLCVSDARALPFAAAVFDGLSQFTLFSSLKRSADRRAAASEMLRVLKPGGFILWHDFFVPNPLNRRTRPVSKREIRSLFDGCEIRFERVTLLAPLARICVYLFGKPITALERISLLRTHYLALITKPAIL